MRPIILASQSARRIELLKNLGYSFEVMPADIDETIHPGLKPQDEIQRLAKNKAERIFEKHQDALVIGADTVVTIDDCILGKPKDEADACAMLNRLSARKHQVITGVCLLTRERCEVFANISDVTFYPLTAKDIQNYIATKEPMDKAGAYAIQGKAMVFIKSISGDYYSIMGLPVAEIAQRLKSFDLS